MWTGRNNTILAGVSHENLTRHLTFEIKSEVLIQQVGSGKEGHASHMTECVFWQEFYMTVPSLVHLLEQRVLSADAAKWTD